MTASSIAPFLMVGGMLGMLSYLVHFIWASFHTRADVSQSSSLFNRQSVLDKSRYTPEGQRILRRMWLSVLFGVVLFGLGVVAANRP